VQIAELSTRAPYGQGIDVTDGAVTVVKAMGLFETIKAQTTGETGFALLDDQAREIGRVGTNPADDKQAGFSPTQEIEVRSQMGRVDRSRANFQARSCEEH
jgi:hypothetical protein